MALLMGGDFGGGVGAPARVGVAAGLPAAGVVGPEVCGGGTAGFCRPGTGWAGM